MTKPRFTFNHDPETVRPVCRVILGDDPNLIKVLRSIRRKVRREAGQYTQISAAQVVAWIDEEIRRTKA